ncbi:hypothetical protein FRC10_009234 [Ceratobasidium sp. 414]|nr:hypothetical protein FRC10_009234 [Ceratobasidium sp. 414]
MTTLLRWGCVKGLYEAAVTIELVSTKFTERIPELERNLASWRVKTERQLISNLSLERKPGAQTEVKVSDTNLSKVVSSECVHTQIYGSTDLTAGLSPNTRFLLRADTIFKRSLVDQKSANSWSDFGGLTTCPLGYYPDLLVSSKGPKTIPPEPIDLSRFTRYVEAEQVAKALLANLGEPDVAYMELKAIGNGFSCGRCYKRKRMTWEGVIEHYREMNDKWEKDATYQREQQTRHRIVFVNTHDLGVGQSSDKQLIEFPSLRNDAKSCAGSRREVECKLCLVGWNSATYDCMEGMIEHVRNVKCEIESGLMTMSIYAWFVLGIMRFFITLVNLSECMRLNMEYGPLAKWEAAS